jgi:outer membrane protein assembly factor BamA
MARNNIIAVETIDHIPRFIDFRRTARDLRTGGFTYTYRPNFYSFHDFGTSFTRIQLLDTVATINPNFFGEGQTQQQFKRLFYQYRRDVRDAINYPLRGSNLQLLVEKFGLGEGDDIDFWQFTASYAKYIPLGSEFYFGTFGSARLMNPKEQPYNRLVALGFRQFYVRSFELDLIEGHQYLLHKNSLRKKLIGSSYTLPKPFDQTPFSTIPFAFYLKAFVDHGWVGNRLAYPNNDRLSNQYLLGYGLGIDFVTYYDLVFKLEYGRNNAGTGGLFLNFRADF